MEVIKHPIKICDPQHQINYDQAVLHSYLGLDTTVASSRSYGAVEPSEKEEGSLRLNLILPSQWRNI
jgi:hypothetical protein